MKQYFKRLSEHPFWLFGILLALVVVADTLIEAIWDTVYFGILNGNSTLWRWGSPGIYEGGLQPNAAFNSLWHELWFAEALAFIIMPVVLWKYQKHKRRKILPWILTGALALAGMVSTFLNYHSTAVTPDNPYPVNSNYAELLHNGPTIPFYTVPFNTIFAGDPALESEFPDFIISQAPYAAVLIIGYLLFGRRATIKGVNNS